MKIEIAQIKQKIELKAFRGDVNPPKDNMQGVAFPMVYPHLTTEKLKENTRLIQSQIAELIEEEMQRIQTEKENAIEAEADRTRINLTNSNPLPFQSSIEEEIDEHYNNEEGDLDFSEEIEIEEDFYEKSEIENKGLDDILKRKLFDSIPDINHLKKS